MCKSEKFNYRIENCFFQLCPPKIDYCNVSAQLFAAFFKLGSFRTKMDFRYSMTSLTTNHPQATSSVGGTKRLECDLKTDSPEPFDKTLFDFRNGHLSLFDRKNKGLCREKNFVLIFVFVLITERKKLENFRAFFMSILSSNSM